MKSIACACLLLGSLSLASAQTPIPIVVQAANAAPAPAAPAVAQTPAADPAIAAVLKTLKDLRAANEEVLRKQAATLQQLDELQKAAEQLKIYSKRG